MDINEEYELSCYKTLSKLHDKKEIYLVRHIETGILGVKKLLRHYDKNLYLRLKNLDIANIPKLLLCIDNEDTLVIVEEFIHGKTLKEYIDTQGCMNEEEVIKIALSICNILSQLHECKPSIIHRDIKPSNIMISNDDVVKLIDFNAAREYKEGETNDTVLMGTHDYAAPEQYGFAQSDARTDIYGLGVTMKYLLTGDSAGKKEYHGSLATIIKNCTEVSMKDRYPDISALKADLQHCYKKTTGNSLVRKSDKNYIFFTKSTHKKEWLPVGFRTGALWKMLSAIIGYSLIIWLCFTSEFKAKNGEVLTGYTLFANQIAVFLILIGYVFFIGNYKNIRYRLPYMNKNKIIHFFMSILYMLAWFLIVVILLVLATHG